jgi:hypothetical protein
LNFGKSAERKENAKDRESLRSIIFDGGDIRIADEIAPTIEYYHPSSLCVFIAAIYGYAEAFLFEKGKKGRWLNVRK